MSRQPNHFRSEDPRLWVFLGPLISKLVAHRVAQRLGEIPWDQEPKDPDVRMLGRLASDSAALEVMEREWSAAERGEGGDR